LLGVLRGFNQQTAVLSAQPLPRRHQQRRLEWLRELGGFMTQKCTSCCEALTHAEIEANEALGRDSYDNFFCSKCEDIPILALDAEGNQIKANFEN
jgi:hypothetical protein